mmetsp:Transcript_29334/g.89830  ORF Transcript_29334/g.89830 Transcript_29334/m.89830 type:complete len:84 (+) Transcript_29334:343-594(+)|eukprot:scaffold124251_cov36-Tisochrysis_lutea.AAC.2
MSGPHQTQMQNRRPSIDDLLTALPWLNQSTLDECKSPPSSQHIAYGAPLVADAEALPISSGGPLARPPHAHVPGPHKVAHLLV